MNETTKKLAEALELMIDSHGMHGPCRNNSCKSCDYSYKKAKKAILEYREQEKKPKTELVELDKASVYELLEKYKFAQGYVEFVNELCQTFGTKRISVGDIKSIIRTHRELPYEPNWINSLSEEIHQIIYGKAVENEQVTEKS